MRRESGRPKFAYQAVITYRGETEVSRQTVFAVDEADAKLEALANYARPLCYGSIYLDKNYQCDVTRIQHYDLELGAPILGAGDIKMTGFTLVILCREEFPWALDFMRSWQTEVSGILYPFYCVYYEDREEYFSEELAKPILKKLIAGAGRALVVASSGTKDLEGVFKWQLEICLDLDIPIIVANRNGKRELDVEHCPTLLFGRTVMHVDYEPRIIVKALQKFCDEYAQFKNRTDVCCSGADYEDLRISRLLYPHEKYPIKPGALPHILIGELQYMQLIPITAESPKFQCTLAINESGTA